MYTEREKELFLLSAEYRDCSYSQDICFNDHLHIINERLSNKFTTDDINKILYEFDKKTTHNVQPTKTPPLQNNPYYHPMIPHNNEEFNTFKDY